MDGASQDIHVIERRAAAAHACREELDLDVIIGHIAHHDHLRSRAAIAQGQNGTGFADNGKRPIKEHEVGEIPCDRLLGEEIARADDHIRFTR